MWNENSEIKLMNLKFKNSESGGFGQSGSIWLNHDVNFFFYKKSQNNCKWVSHIWHLIHFINQITLQKSSGTETEISQGHLRHYISRFLKTSSTSHTTANSNLHRPVFSSNGIRCSVNKKRETGPGVRLVILPFPSYYINGSLGFVFYPIFLLSVAGKRPFFLVLLLENCQEASSVSPSTAISGSDLPINCRKTCILCRGFSGHFHCLSDLSISLPENQHSSPESF